MTAPLTRRGFLKASVAAAAVPAAAASATSRATSQAPFQVPTRRQVVRPTAVGSRNAIGSVKIAVEAMAKGEAPVDAAVLGIRPVEDDPADMSVGYGGLPNERCVVELDACVMDGPSGLAGAVAALQRIKNPSAVALKVMRHTDHVLLVGQGALEFARAHGFKEEELLTDRARRAWLRWKETLSTQDDWLPAAENAAPKADRPGAAQPGQPAQPGKPRRTGTIHVSAIDEHGDLGACTSTSGLAFKIPGRVGDSPLIGCGLYTDNDHGSAGSTGRGEAVILSNGSAFIVQQMALGRSPEDACLDACKRIVRLTRIQRLLDAAGQPDFQVNFYALNKKGETGAAAIYPSRHAAFTENGPEVLDSAHLFEKK